ncbi:MAG: hypothetical protein IPI20_13085 [Rhodoferax sp.]|nr:hypothetical protein [Rhodoferax sp.]
MEQTVQDLAVMVPDEAPSFAFLAESLCFSTLDAEEPKWERVQAGLVPGKAFKLKDVLPDGFLGGKVEDWAEPIQRQSGNGRFIARRSGIIRADGVDGKPAVPARRCLPLSAFKLPHHASKNNVSRELIAAFPAKHYLVSTNGQQFNHPDEEAIARILTLDKKTAKTIHFNCPSDFNEVWKSKSYKNSWNYGAFYGTKVGGLVVNL